MNILKAFLVLGCLIPTFLLPAQTEISFGSASSDQGTSIEIDVTTTNFTDITTFQYSLGWDSTVLKYESVSNLNSDINLNLSLFGQPAGTGREDRLTISWVDPLFEGKNLSDGALLYTVHFSVIGDPCDETSLTFANDPTPVEFRDVNGPITGTSNDGNVDVTPCNSSGDLELTVSMETGNTGDTVCVQVTANGFQDIVSAAWNHTYDPNLLDFVGFTNFNVPGLDQGSFGVNEGSGTIFMSYIPPGGMNVSVADGTVLYEICYRITGPSGQIATVDLRALPGRPVEIFKEENGMDVEVTPDVTNGKITIEGVFNGLSIYFDDQQVQQGDTVCMTLWFANATDIQGIQDIFVNWDPTVLDFINTQDRQSPGIDFLPNESKVDIGEWGFIYAYVDPSDGSGWTPSGNPAQFIDLCFEAIGDCDESTLLTVSDDAFIVNSSGMIIPYQGGDANVDVICSSCEAAPVVINESCTDDCDGSIDLNLSFCSNITNIEWCCGLPSGISQTSQSNLCAGTYSVTITYDGGNEQLILIDLVVGKDTVALDDVTINKEEAGNDGEVLIDVSGGSGNYTFAWDDPNSSNTQNLTGVPGGDYTVTVSDADNPGCFSVFGPFTVPARLVVIGDVMQISCFGELDGAIDLTVTGGTEPYTYDWSCDGVVDGDGNISGLGEGACTITVTDAANCTETATFQIVEPDAITIDDVIIVDDTDGDAKGSISLDVSGGTGDLDYNWSEAGLPNSPLAENLLGGTYTVTITDENDCELIVTYEVEGIRIMGTVVGVSCFGEVDGGVDVLITGGSGNYDFSWTCNGQIDPDGSIDGLPAGEECTITVMDMDTDLSAEATFTITGPDAALNGEFKFNECDEDITMAEVIIAGGTEPYTITWNTIPPQTGPKATDLEPGQDLIVIVRDANDCELMLTGSNTECIGEADCFTASKAITPNLDGKNDNLIIKCIFDYSNRLTIYNRWGQQVFVTENYQNNWQGTETGGSTLEDGTYYWVLEVFLANNQTDIYKGAVSVLRELN